MEDLELKQAYEELALPESATKEEVEERYFLLLKKKKTGQSIDEEKITAAYKRIAAYQLQVDAQKYDEQHYAGSKTRKAIDDFWHRYKFQVLISGFALLVLILGVQEYMDKRAEKIALAKLPPSNLDVMFVGEYQQTDESDLGEALLPLFPEWQRIKVFVSYNPKVPKNEFDIAATQKNVINLITEVPDIYITDEHNFNLLTNQGAFLKLDQWAHEFPALQLLTNQVPEEDASYYYGIDLSGSAPLEELQLFGTDKMIISLRYDTENIENSLLFIKRLLEKQ